VFNVSRVLERCGDTVVKELGSTTSLSLMKRQNDNISSYLIKTERYPKPVAQKETG
jgi:F0F1-type ATP synthase alpha subunit